MDPTPQSSFIPKQPLNAPSHSGIFGWLLFIIAFGVFVVSLAAAGGVLAYGNILQGQLADKDKSLRADQNAFDPKTIEEYVRLDTRMVQARALISRHVDPLPVFDFLSTIALQKVQFTSFDFTLQSDGSGKISLSGVGDSFSTIALQSDAFGATRDLKDVIFSGVNIGAVGAVTFSVDATIDKSRILFSNTLKQ